MLALFPRAPPPTGIQPLRSGAASHQSITTHQESSLRCCSASYAYRCALRIAFLALFAVRKMPTLPARARGVGDGSVVLRMSAKPAPPPRSWGSQQGLSREQTGAQALQAPPHSVRGCLMPPLRARESAQGGVCRSTQAPLMPRCTPQGPGQPRSRAKRGLYQALAAPAARPRHDSGCGRCLAARAHSVPLAPLCPSGPDALRGATMASHAPFREASHQREQQRASGNMTSEPFARPAHPSPPRHRQGCTARLARAGPCRRKGAACASGHERAVGAPSFPRFRQVRGAQVRASEAGAVQPALLRHAS